MHLGARMRARTAGVLVAALAIGVAATPAGAAEGRARLYLVQSGDCTASVDRWLSDSARPSRDCPGGSAVTSGTGRTVAEIYPVRGTRGAHLGRGTVTGSVTVRTARNPQALGSLMPDQPADYAAIDIVLVVGTTVAGRARVEGTLTPDQPLTAPVSFALPDRLTGRSLRDVSVRVEWSTSGAAAPACYANEVAAAAATPVYRGLPRRLVCVTEAVVAVSGTARTWLAVPLR